MIFPKKFFGIFLVLIILGGLYYFLEVKQGLFSSGKNSRDSASEEVVETAETPLPVKIRKVERGRDVDAFVPDVEDVSFDQLHSRGLVGSQLADIVHAPPLERIGVEVDPPCVVVG